MAPFSVRAGGRGGKSILPIRGRIKGSEGKGRVIDCGEIKKLPRHEQYKLMYRDIVNYFRLLHNFQ